MHGQGPESKGFYSFACRHPERIAYIDPEGASTTFGQLLDRVNGLSNGLRARGLRTGDAVAVLLKNCQAYFELALATGQLGLYLVPVNWHLTADEVAYIVRDSDSKILIASHEFAQNLVSAELPDLRFAVGAVAAGWQEYDELLGDSRSPAERSAGSLMGYTSGTTGMPKGVKRKLAGKSPRKSLRINPTCWHCLAPLTTPVVIWCFRPCITPRQRRGRSRPCIAATRSSAATNSTLSWCCGISSSIRYRPYIWCRRILSDCCGSRAVKNTTFQV